MRLVDHFECLNGTPVKVERDGEIVAFLSYAWIKDYQDMRCVDEGEEGQGIPGEILYIFNVRVDHNDPRLIWELRRKLPSFRWIVGLDDAYHLHAPKGVPEDFHA